MEIGLQLMIIFHYQIICHHFFFRLIVKFIRVCLISITPEMNLNL